MALLLSAKQKHYWKHSSAKINISHGSVRSGKTFITNLRFLHYVRHGPPGTLLLSGRTKDSIRENVLNDLFKIVGADNYTYQEQKGILIMFGRRIEVRGAEKADAEPAIRGRTYAGWYADEVTIQHPEFVKQAILRCSVPAAQMFWTTNPDSPFHYIKTDFVDAAGNNPSYKVWHFTLDDNLALSKDYVDLLKTSFTGVFYQRFILGLWVMAEGIIYSGFDSDRHVVDGELPPMLRYWIGCDYGTQNPTTFLFVGLAEDGNLYIIDEYYHSGRESGRQKSPAKYSEEFREWLQGHGITPEWIYIDPAASGFIAQLWADGVQRIAQADNEVMGGIQLVSTLLGRGLLRVHRRCKNTIREFQSYVWDPKKGEKGEDVPLKQHDHCLDALRYVANGTRNMWIKRGVQLPNAAA